MLGIKSAEQQVLLPVSQFIMIKNQSYGTISGKVMNTYLQQTGIWRLWEKTT
jgi:hypothetical protein